MKIALLTTDSREHFRDYTNPTPYFGTAPEALLQGFAQLPDVEVHVVCCVRQRVTAPEKIAPNIFYHALLVPKLGWMSTGYQGCIRAVRKCLGAIKPDIVHGQGTERDNAVCAVFSRMPNVLTIHGNMAELARMFESPIGSYGWLAGQIENFVLPRTLGVFCNSAYTENLVRSRAKRIWRVANPIREKFFDPPEPTDKKTRPGIINVGVVSPRKRQVEILQIARVLHEQGRQLEFQFVGACSPETRYGRSFLREIEEGERAGYARYFGTKNGDELVTLFDSAQAMVHFPTEEAFGLVVPEALARNLKFFGAAVGGIVDIASDVEFAELHPVNDWNGLQRGIAAWIDRDCPKPSSAAAMIAARFKPKIIAARHVEIYREVLGKNH